MSHVDFKKWQSLPSPLVHFSWRFRRKKKNRLLSDRFSEGTNAVSFILILRSLGFMLHVDFKR